MTPFDIRLPIIAAAARVKPCHVFHQFCAMKEMGASFHVEAFALFTGLEVKHVEAILSALQEHDCLPTKTARTSSVRGTRLPNDWTVPDEWIEWAGNEKHWHPSDAREEAEIFANFWQAKSGAQATKLDWRKTWINWCKNSRRPNGDYVAVTVKQSPAERASFLRRSIALYESMGREDETDAMKRELATIDDNILPFERKVG